MQFSADTPHGDVNLHIEVKVITFIFSRSCSFQFCMLVFSGGNLFPNLRPGCNVIPHTHSSIQDGSFF